MFPRVRAAPEVSAASQLFKRKTDMRAQPWQKPGQEILCESFAVLCGYVLISWLLAVQLLNLLCCHHLRLTILHKILLLTLNPLNQVVLN